VAEYLRRQMQDAFRLEAPRALATLRRLHTGGASEYVQYHAAATLLDRQLDQAVQQQALIVNINLGPDSPLGEDGVLGSALAFPKGPICGTADDEGDQAGGAGEVVALVECW